MEILSIVALLWRRRWLVLAGAALALVCGAAVSGKLGSGASSAVHPSWQVSEQAQIDTPQPVAADAEANSDALQIQAVLFADYLTSNGSQAAIARMSHVSPASLTVVTPSIDVPIRQSPLVTAAQETTAPATPYAVTAITWPDAPIVTIAASGPDRDVTTRIANSAMKVLSSGVGAAVQGTDKQLVAVRPLGSPRVAMSVSAGRGKVVGVGLALFLFLAWCIAIVIGTGIVRHWRMTSARVAAGQA